MFQLETDIRVVHVYSVNHPCRLWTWRITATITDARAKTAFDTSGLATSLEAAQAELTWAASLIDLKLRFLGFDPAS